MFLCDQKKIDKIKIEIPEEFNKSSKYYYGIIKYLLEEQFMFTHQINFRSTNQEELKKITLLLDYYKKIEEAKKEINLYVKTTDKQKVY